MVLDKSPSGNPDFPEIRNNFSRLSCQSGTAGAVSDWFGKVERSANGVPQVRCQIGSGRGERSANGVPQVRCQIGSGRGERSANGVAAGAVSDWFGKG